MDDVAFDDDLYCSHAVKTLDDRYDCYCSWPIDDFVVPWPKQIELKVFSHCSMML